MSGWKAEEYKASPLGWRWTREGHELFWFNTAGGMRFRGWSLAREGDMSGETVRVNTDIKPADVKGAQRWAESVMIESLFG